MQTAAVMYQRMAQQNASLGKARKHTGSRVAPVCTQGNNQAQHRQQDDR